MKRVLLFLVLTLTLFGCELNTDATTAEKDYSDFPNLIIDDPEDQLSQNYDVYYLYFYGPYCPACNNIKEEVLSKIELLDNDMIFLVQAMQLSDVNEHINVTKTPSLVRIINNQVDEIYESGETILTVLDTLS